MHPLCFDIIFLRMATTHSVAPGQLSNEAAMATTLHYLSGKAPLAVSEMFRPMLNMLDRTVASLTLFTDPQPARDAFLSPIGILHLFREYFFQMGTFLGPPVGHVWISPGGTLELVESNTRRTLTEQTVEQSTEKTTKSELDQTDKDELSDAVKTEMLTIPSLAPVRRPVVESVVYFKQVDRRVSISANRASRRRSRRTRK